MIVFDPIQILSILSLFLIIFILFFWNYSQLRAKYRNIYFVLIILKIIVLFYEYYNRVIPLSGADWKGYSYRAIQILHFNATGFFDIFTCFDYNLFDRIVASFFYLLGENPLYIHLVVFIFSLINFYYIVKASYEITEDYDLSQKIGLFWTVWPIAFIHTIAFLREEPIMCFFTISFYYMVKYFKAHNLIDFGLALLFSIMCAMLHSGMVVVVLTYVFVFSIISHGNNINLSPFKIIIAILILLVIMQTTLKKQMTEKFAKYEDIEDVIEVKQTVQGRTAYISETPSNPVDLILQTPYRFIMFILSPFIWNVHSMGQFVSLLLDALPRLFIVYCLYHFLIKERTRGTPTQVVIKTSALLIIIGFDLLFCWGTDTFGTAIRHRAKILPMELIMVFWYLNIKKKEQIFIEDQNDEDQNDEDQNDEDQNDEDQNDEVKKAEYL